MATLVKAIMIRPLRMGIQGSFGSFCASGFFGFFVFFATINSGMVYMCNRAKDKSEGVGAPFALRAYPLLEG